MQNSIFIAKLVGPIITAFGLALMLNRNAVEEIIETALQHKSVTILAGLPPLLAGLAIVNTHNIWTAGLPLVITLFGWLALIGGLSRVLVPGVTQSAGKSLLKMSAALPAAFSLWIALGVYLIYQGYLA